MKTITIKNIAIPCGLSGIMSYSHVKTGRYPVSMTKPEHTCVVIIKEATDCHLLMELEVSENLANVANKGLFHLQALEASGVLNKKLVYYKN